MYRNAFLKIVRECRSRPAVHLSGVRGRGCAFRFRGTGLSSACDRRDADRRIRSPDRSVVGVVGPGRERRSRTASDREPVV